MPVDDLEPLRVKCDRILLGALPDGMRDQIARFHQKGIPRRTMSRLLKKVGGTLCLVLACEAEWDRLEAILLQRE